MLTITLPFSLDSLQIALRRHLAHPDLSVGEVVPAKMGGGASGSPVYRLDVSYDGGLGDYTDRGKVSLVLKRGTRHTGGYMAGAARREARFYSTLAPQLPLRTPHLILTGEDVAGKGDAPLVVGAPSRLVYGWGDEGGPDWVLMEALPHEEIWPHAAWTGEHYRIALEALAGLHAQWWDRPPSAEEYPWIWMPTGAHTRELLEEARAALLEIESAPWGEKFFARERLREWLNVLDNPQCVLDILSGTPQTLIHGDYWPGNIAMRREGPAVFDWQQVGVGPASYDLACFHASSRWWFGRLPLTLTEMRSHYMLHLHERLGYKVDRYIFDVGIDAARAWRFAVLWPPTIVEHRAHLLARLTYFRSTVIEPAYASLRRSV